MRTIKFRGRTEGLNGSHVWIYGYPYGGDKHGMSVDINDAFEVQIINYDYDEWSIEKETLGQFTGLFDKNGKEIYEGDIVQEVFDDGDCWMWKIVWVNEDAMFNAVSLTREKCGDIFVGDIGGEVIGNVTENPELI